MTTIIIFLCLTIMCFAYFYGAIILFGKLSDDNTLLMMLRSESKNYYDHNGDREDWFYTGCTMRQRPWKNGDIRKLKWNPFFVYAIDGMGPVPFWFEANAVIKTLPGNY
jgi:hypothetical protein